MSPRCFMAYGSEGVTGLRRCGPKIVFFFFVCFFLLFLALQAMFFIGMEPF